MTTVSPSLAAAPTGIGKNLTACTYTSAGGTEFAPLLREMASGTTEGAAQSDVMPFAGTLEAVFVNCTTLGAGSSLIVRLNGGDTSIAGTITGTGWLALSGAAVSFVAGDLLSLSMTSTSGTATITGIWAIIKQA